MQTIKAKEAAQAAININRVDWIHGAAELVLNNQVQYDRSTERSKEAFISRENVLCDIDVMPTLNKWLDGGECCDCRDELRELLRNELCVLLSQMADDFEIGVE